MSDPVDWSIGGITSRSDVCTLDSWWRDVKFEYDVSNNLLYAGKHYIHNVSDDDLEWAIWKFSYNESNYRTRIEGPLKGSWTGRSSLDWGV